MTHLGWLMELVQKCERERMVQQTRSREPEEESMAQHWVAGWKPSSASLTRAGNLRENPRAIKQEGYGRPCL